MTSAPSTGDNGRTSNSVRASIAMDIAASSGWSRYVTAAAPPPPSDAAGAGNLAKPRSLVVGRSCTFTRNPYRGVVTRQLDEQLALGGVGILCVGNQRLHAVQFADQVVYLVMSTIFISSAPDTLRRFAMPRQVRLAEDDATSLDPMQRGLVGNFATSPLAPYSDRHRTGGRSLRDFCAPLPPATRPGQVQRSPARALPAARRVSLQLWQPINLVSDRCCPLAIRTGHFALSFHRGIPPTIAVIWSIRLPCRYSATRAA